MDIFKRILSNTKGDVALLRMRRNPKANDYDSPTEELFTRDLEKISTFIGNGTGDVFHGLATRKPGCRGNRKEHVYEAVCIAIDVDFKDVSVEEYGKILKKFPCRPTMIINSGNGRHLYWFFSKPFVVDSNPRKIAYVEGIARGISQHFKGDSTYNINRILRTPGRKNSKYPNRPLCHVIWSNGPEYSSLHDLQRFRCFDETASGIRKITIKNIPAYLPEKFEALLESDETIKATWDGRRNNFNDSTRSGYDMSMASMLAHRGYSPEEIAAVLKQMPSGKGKTAHLSMAEIKCAR